MIDAGSWLVKLQSCGYRLTGPRRAVVQVLADSRYTLNPAQVFAEARRISPRIGLVTVYRTIEKLEELGMVTRVHEVDGCHAYIAAPVGHQHLLICRSCSRAEYFKGEDLSPLTDRLGEERGYQIQDHWLQLFGLCPQCRRDA